MNEEEFLCLLSSNHVTSDFEVTDYLYDAYCSGRLNVIVLQGNILYIKKNNLSFYLPNRYRGKV